jgi:hypothetical protein
MVTREDTDTSKHGNGGSTLGGLSNDEIFGFFNNEKVVAIVSGLYDISQNALKDADRISASKEILDRLLGKAKQTVDNNVNLPGLIKAAPEDLNPILDKLYGSKQPNYTGEAPIDKGQAPN